jgi:hypothetical protein
VELLNDSKNKVRNEERKPKLKNRKKAIQEFSSARGLKAYK